MEGTIQYFVGTTLKKSFNALVNKIFLLMGAVLITGLSILTSAVLVSLLFLWGATKLTVVPSPTNTDVSLATATDLFGKATQSIPVLVLGVLWLLLILFIIMVFTAGYFKLMLNYAMTGVVRIHLIFSQLSVRRSFTIFLASILSFLIIFLGFMLLVIPGIYLFLRLSFYLFLIIDNDAGIIESLKKSWQLTKGYEVRLLMLIIAVFLIDGVVWFARLSLAFIPIIGPFFAWVVNVAINAFQALVMTYAYIMVRRVSCRSVPKAPMPSA